MRIGEACRSMMPRKGDGGEGGRPAAVLVVGHVGLPVLESESEVRIEFVVLPEVCALFVNGPKPYEEITTRNLRAGPSLMCTGVPLADTPRAVHRPGPRKARPVRRRGLRHCAPAEDRPTLEWRAAKRSLRLRVPGGTETQAYQVLFVVAGHAIPFR